MKRTPTTLIVLLLILFGVNSGKAQTNQDYNEIISKCIGLQQFKSNFPLDANGEVLSPVIMYHGIHFPTNLSIEVYGKQVVFNTKEQINATGVKCFFMFRELNISGTNARAEFVYYYDYNGSYDKYTTALVTLQKNSEGVWQINNLQIGGSHE
jgi:hypothetical protein